MATPATVVISPPRRSALGGSVPATVSTHWVDPNAPVLAEVAQRATVHRAAAPEGSYSVPQLQQMLREQEDRNRQLSRKLATPRDPLGDLRREQQELERRLREMERDRAALEEQVRERQQQRLNPSAKRKLRPKQAAAEPPKQTPPLLDVTNVTPAAGPAACDDQAFLLKLHQLTEENRGTVSRLHQELDEKAAAGPAAGAEAPAEPQLPSTHPHQTYLVQREKRLVPQPFSMEQREAERRAYPSATQRRKRADIESLREEEARVVAAGRRGPVANPVPPSTFINRFELLQAEWVARREAAKERARAEAERMKAPAPGFVASRPRVYVRRALTTDDLPDAHGDFGFAADSEGRPIYAPSRVPATARSGRPEERGGPEWPPYRGCTVRQFLSRSHSVPAPERPGRVVGYVSVAERLSMRKPFRATAVPRQVREQRWHQICENEVARRLRVKEQARLRHAELTAQAPSRFSSSQPTSGAKDSAQGPAGARSSTPAPTAPGRVVGHDAVPATVGGRRSASSSGARHTSSARASGSPPCPTGPNFTFKPKITPGVPNFPKLWEQDRQKRQDVATAVRGRKPSVEPQEFRLSRGSGLKSAEAVVAEIEFDERTMPETRWPQMEGRRRPRRRSPPYTTYERDPMAPQFKYTKAAQLSLVANMQRIVDRDAQKRQEAAEQAERRCRQKAVSVRVQRHNLYAQAEAQALQDTEPRKELKEPRMPGQPNSPKKRAKRLQRFAEAMRSKVDEILEGQPPIWLRTPGVMADDHLDAQAVAAHGGGGDDDGSSYSEGDKDVSRGRETTSDAAEKSPASAAAPAAAPASAAKKKKKDSDASSRSSSVSS
eukprot:TRINITY_DN59912_c0_g1_i1.p1 TRINITY_DN59912_c0_g1~~TRINITY_DN59912_c0_g1_i1.p1  ORF type:complete len:836 (+),score=224.44 TRINITY_DN59912_c0_g1_i1:88-2595(+)